MILQRLPMFIILRGPEKIMWKTKKFKTFEGLNNWIAANSLKYQYVVLYINNGYAVECKKLRKVC